MANIDVTDLLADPDMVDPVILVHRTACVDERGQNQLKSVGVDTWGSVQPASGKTLNRLPDLYRVLGVMSFWVKGQIVTDGKGLYPDQIVHNGSHYNVQVVFDWGNWGGGWCEGTCVRAKPAI